MTRCSPVKTAISAISIRGYGSQQPQYSVGDQVLIERETSLRVDERTDKDRIKNEFAPQMEGPFPIVALEEHTVTILRTTRLKDRVSTDRIVKAPLRTKLTEPGPPEVTVPVEFDAELMPPMAMEDDTSALLPAGVTIPPEEDGRDPRGPSISPSGSTDLESRDTTRNRHGTENANNHAKVTRQSQSESLPQSAGVPQHPDSWTPSEASRMHGSYPK